MLCGSDFIRAALEEDLGFADITSEAIIPSSHRSQAILLAKEKGVLAGSDWFSAFFRFLDPEVEIHWHKNDSEEMLPGETVATLKGQTKALLGAERTALNLLQNLCGIATFTQKAVACLENSPIRLLDTRKTLPLLRVFQKYAVKAGGGTNHRFGLFDMFLIKENHIRAAGSLSEAITRCRSFAHHKKIEVETTNLSEVKEAVAAAPDIIMLDNMSDTQLMEASLYIREKSGILTEASGNMTLDRLLALRHHPLDFISMGSLIHSAKALDLSFLLTN